MKPNENNRNSPPRPRINFLATPTSVQREFPGRCMLRRVKKLVCLFTSLLAIPLACQSCFDATLLTGLQVIGVTLDFLDDVLLLYLPLKPAQRIFERLAFLYANLCQKIPPPNLPWGYIHDTGNSGFQVK